MGGWAVSPDVPRRRSDPSSRGSLPNAVRGPQGGGGGRGNCREGVWSLTCGGAPSLDHRRFSGHRLGPSSSSHSRPHPSQRRRAPSGQTRTVRVDGTAPNGRGQEGQPEPLARTSRSCSWGGSRSVRSQSVRCASLQCTSSSFFPERRPCFAASQKMRRRRAWLVMPFARNARPSASMRWSNERSTERMFSGRSSRCHKQAPDDLTDSASRGARALLCQRVLQGLQFRRARFGRSAR